MAIPSTRSGWLDPADPDPAHRTRCAAWLAFQRLYAFDPEQGARRLAQAGGPRAVLRGLGLALHPGAERDALATLARVGARGLVRRGPGFPERLVEIRDAPNLLWVRGDVAALSAPAVAVVGARAASSYGLGVAAALAACFARAGLVVVSGLAFGIDAAAHRAALAAGGRTVAVLGCGPDRTYPAAHRRLAEEAVRQGAVVSEFPPGTPPRGAHFPLRNRLVAGLAQAVVVVEARERSGSLSTAGHAAEQGREVFAVPGPLGVATSAGTNRLLRDGAQLLLDADDVLQHLGLCPGAARPGGAALPSHPILRALAAAPATRDELARRLGVSPRALALDLLELELGGAVTEGRDGRLRLAASPSL